MQRLLRVTQESLQKGIAQVRLGGRVSDIGHAIQEHVEAAGFRSCASSSATASARELHEEPQIANYGEPGRGPRLAEGMVLAIEPMVNMGRPAVKVLRDGWTAVTRDGSLSAHFEHTVAVTKDGPLVLTERAAASAAARIAARMQPGREAMPVSVEGTVLRVAAARALPGRDRSAARSRRRTRRAGRDGISSASSSAIACGWSCRRAT